MITVMLSSAMIEGKLSNNMIKRYKTRWVVEVLRVIPTIFLASFILLCAIQFVSFGSKEYYQIMLRNTLLVVNLFIIASYLVLSWFIVDDAKELGELLDCPNIGTLSEAELVSLASKKLEELLRQLNSFGDYEVPEVEHGLAVRLVATRKYYQVFGLSLPGTGKK